MSIKVLVVDDEYMTRDLLRLVLERYRFQVFEAGNGLDALQKISQNKPDIIILDVMMPRMDGIEMTQKLRGNPETADLPVIMISAKSHQMAVREGLDAGANMYMAKPVNQRKLVANIQELTAVPVIES